MRRDATIDRQQVKCFNASTLGYGQWKARVGDWILWRVTDADGNTIDTPLGRMIGRVHYAPSLDPRDRQVKDFLCVLQLSDDHTHVFERWIDPADVLRVHRNHPNIAALLTWFATFDPKSEPVDFWRGAAHHGSLGASLMQDPPSGCDWSFAGAMGRWREVWARMRGAA